MQMCLLIFYEPHVGFALFYSWDVFGEISIIAGCSQFSWSAVISLKSEEHWETVSDSTRMIGLSPDLIRSWYLGCRLDMYCNSYSTSTLRPWEKVKSYNSSDCISWVIFPKKKHSVFEFYFSSIVAMLHIKVRNAILFEPLHVAVPAHKTRALRFTKKNTAYTLPSSEYAMSPPSGSGCSFNPIAKATYREGNKVSR